MENAKKIIENLTPRAHLKITLQLYPDPSVDGKIIFLYSTDSVSKLAKKNVFNGRIFHRHPQMSVIHGSFQEIHLSDVCN